MSKSLRSSVRTTHPRRDVIVEGYQVSAFRRWTRENFNREPHPDEIDRFLKGLK